MWHIVAIGYLFVAVMFSAAQPSIARALIYLVFWAVLPTAFTVFVVRIRRRNRLMKQQEQAEFEQQRAQMQPTPTDGKENKENKNAV